jgi:hypothetical protein
LTVCFKNTQQTPMPAEKDLTDGKTLKFGLKEVQRRLIA